MLLCAGGVAVGAVGRASARPARGQLDEHESVDTPGPRGATAMSVRSLVRPTDAFKLMGDLCEGAVASRRAPRRRPRRVTLIFGVSVLALTSGCLPFATPPMQGSVGAAAWRPSPATGPLPAVAVGARVRPLAFAPTMQNRPFDPGIGVAYMVAPHEHRDADWQVGPTLGADAYPGAYVDGDFRARFVIGGELRALYQDLATTRASWGFGTAARIGLELVEWVDGCRDSSDSHSFAFACGAGEGGGGFYAEGGLGYFGDGVSYALSLTLEFRIPGAVGIVGRW
jgi:hypothetical protein